MKGLLYNVFLKGCDLHNRLTRYGWYYKAYCQFTLIEWIVVLGLLCFVIKLLLVKLLSI